MSDTDPRLTLPPQQPATPGGDFAIAGTQAAAPPADAAVAPAGSLENVSVPAGGIAAQPGSAPTAADDFTFTTTAAPAAAAAASIAESHAAVTPDSAASLPTNNSGLTR